VQNIYTYTVEIDPAVAADVISVTTSTAHGFAVNDPVFITATTSYNGNYTVNAIQSTTQFSIKHAISPSPTPEGAGTATVGGTAKTITSISQDASDMTALLKSVAANGKGKYFGVSSSASGTAIVDALNSIFTEVQAVNSVFASTTLPVSVNVRGTNLNQVYIGVFRPDSAKSPRWLGNLKMYNLALNTATSTVFLADATNGPPPAIGLAAENSSTGFVGQSSPSFWTETSTFWGFRTASENGPGGASDKPDGDLVEKGGAAQMLRTAFATTQAARNLYTCTTGLVGGVLKTCAANSALADTPFATTNDAVSPASLQLDTRFVSPLTALETKAVSALTDRRSVTISNTNPLAQKTVSSITSPGTTRTILTPDVNSPKLTTATPKVITSVTSDVSGSITRTITSITKVSGNFVVLAAGALPSGFVNGATVTFSGFTGANSSNWNGATLAISSVNTTSNTFQVNPSGNPGNVATGSSSISAIIPSTTARVTLGSHGFTSAQSVTINGASPTNYNGTFSITVTDADHFTYTMASAPGATGNATGTITAAGNTTTATATTSADHGFGLVGSTPSILISGAASADCPAPCTAYNGTKTVTITGTRTFTYSVGTTPIGPNTSPTVYAIKDGGTTITVTTNVPHEFGDTDSVIIAGSDVAGYNGTFPISCPGCVAGVPLQTTFTYTAPTTLPANSSATVTATAEGARIATVVATATNHGFVAGDTVIVESTSGDTTTGHANASGWTVQTAPDVNTFTYSTTVALAAPIGSYTVRPPTLSSKAIATVTGHGYGAAGTTKSVTISGASNAAYNGTKTVTIVDANTFTYPMTAAPNSNTSSSVTSSIKTTTARATSVNHGFANGSTVTVAGANPTAFNGSYAIAVVDANTFTYTIGSAEGDASGSILAAQASGSSAERDSIINWVRGQDNFQDENLNTSLTDVRASIHGDVLHSRPAVVNYNRFSGSDDDVFVFYGGNAGVFHAIKGGYAVPTGDLSGITPGKEAWGFVPSEFFSSLKRLRNNSPTISSAFKRPYFMDGPIGVLTEDNTVPANGKLGDVAAGTPTAEQPKSDVVNLYIANRRGGRFIYALDVNTPTSPKFLWKISNSTTGFSELGQTWSQPNVVSNMAGLTTPIVLFGAGYDAAVDDLDPAAITAVDASTGAVTTAAGTSTRTMGRGIFVVNALTGGLIWSAGGIGSGATKEVAGMVYAIPSDITVIRNESGGFPNRAYVGDTGGNVWRIDFKSDTSATQPNLALTTVTKLATLADQTTAAGRRKFLFPPDVVGQQGFDAVLIGSGDREHPFDSTITNRFYMLKDRGGDAGAVTGTTTCDPTILEGTIPDASCTPNPVAGLSDLTSNCIQDVTGCVGTETQAVVSAKLGTDRGWFITLGSGEKVVGNAISIGGTTFFNTNQPSATAGGGTCGSNLGVARQYQVATADATATSDLNAVGGLTAADRSLIHAGGGYLPSPVHVVVKLGDQTVEAVISGIQVSTPPGASLSARLRKYWYREIDPK
jgi:Tfp pilus tip-associated adhesin PilY1